MKAITLISIIVLFGLGGCAAQPPLTGTTTKRFNPDCPNIIILDDIPVSEYPKKTKIPFIKTDNPLVVSVQKKDLKMGSSNAFQKDALIKKQHLYIEHYKKELSTIKHYCDSK